MLPKSFILYGYKSIYKVFGNFFITCFFTIGTCHYQSIGNIALGVIYCSCKAQRCDTLNIYLGSIVYNAFYYTECKTDTKNTQYQKRYKQGLEKSYYQFIDVFFTFRCGIIYLTRVMTLTIIHILFIS